MLVSTSTHGGHVDTIDSKNVPGRRRRRLHSDEFKADAIAAAAQLGVSMAAVALARGIASARSAKSSTARILANKAPGGTSSAKAARRCHGSPCSRLDNGNQTRDQRRSRGGTKSPLQLRSSATQAKQFFTGQPQFHAQQ